MVETKRMRTEHLHDKGAASPENPRTHRTEDMTDAQLRAFDATRNPDGSFDRDKLAAFHKANPDLATEEFTEHLDAGDQPSRVKQFGDTRQAPGASRQPERTVGDDKGNGNG